MERAFDYIELIFESLTADFFAIWFLVGAAIFLVGLLLVGLFTLSRLTGYRTAGRVIGAVNVIRSKTRERNGEIVQIEKKSLFPVYEYQASDGSVRQMRGSEGGTMVHGYTTGASVNLIVREDSGYDDVYDADQRGALYVGTGFVAAGVGMMIAVGSIASAFGVTLLARVCRSFTNDRRTIGRAAQTCPSEAQADALLKIIRAGRSEADRELCQSTSQA